MRATDLMIGDWVECIDSTHKKKVYAQIDAIEEGQTCILVKLDNCNWFLDISFIKPIPLTPEILEKNGVVGILSDCGIDYSSEVYKLRIIRRRNDEGWTIYANHFGLDKKDLFVHELQHALRLCGIKKEIEL